MLRSQTKGGLFYASLFFAVSAFALDFKGYEYRSGKNLELNTENTSWTVLVFLSSKCPCSNNSIEQVNKVYSEFGAKKILWVGVHSNQDEEWLDSKNYFENSDLKIPVLKDENAQIAKKFAAIKTPHVYVLKNDTGQVLYSGGIANSTDNTKADRNYLKEVLHDLVLKGVAPFSYQRVLGCRINTSQ
jgi:peroxiredoxin